MGKPLRILLVEDSDDDAALVIEELQRGGLGLACERVETQPAFKSALQGKEWDLIISDYSLPHYNGLAALADARETMKDIPFILVSGTVDESLAATAMKAGAQDYVLKGQLARLPAVVKREVREAQIRADRRVMQERFVITERMATAGTLAAGVAHEINNPLAVAMASLDFMNTMLARLPSEARSQSSKRRDEEDWANWLEERLAVLEEPLGDMREAITRIRDSIRDIKLFSRPNDQWQGSVDVRRVIESSIRMAWNEIRYRAQLVRDFHDVPLVDAGEGLVAQVVLNLIVNAARAIPEGHAEKNEIRVVLRSTDDRRVIIEVRDTGPGSPREHLESLIEPFFSAKHDATGTSFGLAICHRIVADLGGTLVAESAVGKGTTIRVTLPASKSEHRGMQAATLPPPSRRGRILLVDDEAAFGKLIQLSLALHHDVVPLTSGTDALARIASGERFDVILCDVMMPGATGMDIHEELARTAPEKARRMIFMTGGVFTSKAREFLDRVPNPRVDKPFETTTLLAIISGLL